MTLQVGQARLITKNVEEDLLKPFSLAFPRKSEWLASLKKRYECLLSLPAQKNAPSRADVNVPKPPLTAKPPISNP